MKYAVWDEEKGERLENKPLLGQRLQQKLPLAT